VQDSPSPRGERYVITAEPRQPDAQCVLFRMRIDLDPRANGRRGVAQELVRLRLRGQREHDPRRLWCGIHGGRGRQS